MLVTLYQCHVIALQLALGPLNGQWPSTTLRRAYHVNAEGSNDRILSLKKGGANRKPCTWTLDGGKGGRLILHRSAMMACEWIGCLAFSLW